VGWWDGIYRSPLGKQVHEKVAAPGEPGVALLAGHIDSAAQGHGVFYRLGQAKPGAEVTVIDAKQKVTHWVVTQVQTVLKSALPSSLFVDKGRPQLALVSCGGPFDSATGHYLDNIIAWAIPT
jgi:sortase (surface protein transpeptidase)